MCFLNPEYSNISSVLLPWGCSQAAEQLSGISCKVVQGQIVLEPFGVAVLAW
jgi:hypothetical protein